MRSDIRIALLAIDCDTTRIVYHYLSSFYKVEMVILEDKMDKWGLIKRRIKKLGFVKVIGQLFFQTIVVKTLNILSQKRIRQIIAENNLDIRPIDASVIHRVKSVNDPGTRSLLKSIKAEVFLVNGTRIISKEILSTFETPFINTHLGITPMYRGVHGGYWALANNDKKNFGSTIHLLDYGIDTGNVLCHVFTEPTNKDNFITYPYLQIAAALPCLQKVIMEIVQKNHRVQSTEGTKSTLWYHPTIIQYFANRWQKGVK